MSDFIDGMRLVIGDKLKELEPLVLEYNMLLKQKEITDAWQAERDKLSRKRAKPSIDAVKDYINGLEYDTFDALGLADQFGQNRAWASRIIRGLVETEYIESFGLRKWRRRMVRTGRAKLRVATM